MTMLQPIMRKLLARKDLGTDEAELAMGELIDGNTGIAEAAAFLTALKIKGETHREMAAFAKVMRARMNSITTNADHLLDTAGTGGDGQNTFNISTCAAIVAAGAGAKVAKHGNRAITSACGSTDVLEELDVKVCVNPEEARQQLETIGITFLFAPAFHPAMKNVAQIRKELGFRTVFNFLGPICNPANAKRQLIGVSDKSFQERIAMTVKTLGTEKALIVSSDTDEISISSDTSVLEATRRGIKAYSIAPEEFGFRRSGIDRIRVKNKQESAGMILDVLKGKGGPAREIVLLNSAAAIYSCGLSPTIMQGISKAEAAIGSGAALEKLELLRNGHP